MSTTFEIAAIALDYQTNDGDYAASAMAKALEVIRHGGVALLGPPADIDIIMEMLREIGSDPDLPIH